MSMIKCEEVCLFEEAFKRNLNDVEKKDNIPVKLETNFAPNTSKEVQDAKWASINEILEMIDEETFIPYHKSLVELLFALRGSSTGAHSRRDNKLRLSGK